MLMDEYIRTQADRGVTGSATSEAVSPWIERFIDEYPEYIQSPVLDIGAGDGGFVNYINKNQFGIGIDIFNGAVSKAIRNNVPMILGDAQKGLPFPDKCFKTVTLFHSLEHFIHPEQVIEEINRVLDGHICIIVPIEGESKKAKKFGHYSFYANFEDIKLEGFDILVEEDWGNMLLVIAKNA